MTDSEAFETIVASLDTPMTIVTTRSGDELQGCLVGFSMQCSIDPTRYLVCLSTVNRTFRVARGATTLVVHVLRDAPADRALARLFGEETGDDVDKFQQCQWQPGPDEVPVLPECDWFAGRIVHRFDLGDHAGFLLAVHDGVARRAGEPSLGSVAVRHLDPGHPI